MAITSPNHLFPRKSTIVLNLRPLSQLRISSNSQTPLQVSLHVHQERFARFQAPEAGLSVEDLAQAREWKRNFSLSQLPRGQTTFSRSSGPGGQHVNKTETKATTMWHLDEIKKKCPKLMHLGLKSSQYFAKRSNMLVIHAEVERSRHLNEDANYRKLFTELERIYSLAVPNEQAADKAKKYEYLAKKANNDRLISKRLKSTKKNMRKGGDMD